jgi:FkbM family methyltransferase
MNHAAQGVVRSKPLAFDEIRDLVGRPDPVILEVGANAGTHSKLFLDTFPDCRLFCFEPDVRAIARWKRAINDRRALLAPIALGATDGNVPFHVSGGLETPQRPDGYDKSGSLRAPKTVLQRWPFLTFPKTTEIQCMQLDTWLASTNLDRIDFIWADVQGAEEDLILGAGRALQITRFFYTEYSNEEWYEGQINLSGLIEALPDFEVAALFPADVLFRRQGVRR